MTPNKGIHRIMATTRTTPSQLLVPHHWTADEALTVVAYLERIIAATWATHGEAMADSLFHAQSQAEDLADAPTEPESDFDDDTFPF